MNLIKNPKSLGELLQNKICKENSMKFSGNILSNPLNQYDEASLQGVKEVGQKLVIEGMVKGVMSNNSYSEDLICCNFNSPSIAVLERIFFGQNIDFFQEANNTSIIPDNTSAEEENNYKLTLYAFLAILSEEEIQEFRSWYL